MSSQALRDEITRAIQNSTAAVTIIVQLREGGADDAPLVDQLAAANAALEAAISGGGGAEPPPAT